MTDTNLTGAELARRIGRDKSLVSRWAKQGIIPKQPNGLYDEGEVREALKGWLDPGRSKPILPAQRATAIPLSVNDDEPDPAAYRGRTDLPDDFTCGALWGLHRMAFDIPVWAAEEALSCGASAQLSFALKAILHEDMLDLIHEACCELGLHHHTPTSALPKHLHPPALGDIEPERLAHLACEPVNVAAWAAWLDEVEEARAI